RKRGAADQRILQRGGAGAHGAVGRGPGRVVPESTEGTGRFGRANRGETCEDDDGQYREGTARKLRHGTPCWPATLTENSPSELLSRNEHELDLDALCR